MTEPLFDYKSDEWYHGIFQKIHNIFHEVEATNGDIMVISAMILKGVTDEGMENGISEISVFKDFMNFYLNLEKVEENESK